jgi:tripartite-type tricarboxylate transporter receptor subunit TctC
MIFNGSLAYITPLAVTTYEAIDIMNYEIVTGVSQDDYVLVANPATGFKTVKDMVDAKRPSSTPRRVWGRVASSVRHCCSRRPCVSATAVPFNVGAPALTAGSVGRSMWPRPVGEAAAQVEAGKVTPIVTFATKAADLHGQHSDRDRGRL